MLTHSFPMYPFSTPQKHQKTVRKLLCNCTYNPLKISVKEFVFSRVTDLHPVTLLKTQLFYILQVFRAKALTLN